MCPSRPGAIAGNLLNFLCLLSASALSATNAGRLQNGTVSTGKLNYFSVCCGKASNLTCPEIRGAAYACPPSCPCGGSGTFSAASRVAPSSNEESWPFELSADLCDNSSPYWRNSNAQARFDRSCCVCSHSAFPALPRKAQEEGVPPGAPDKAYLQKIMDGWSAIEPANMAQYYDQGDYNFFDIAPLKYSNWARVPEGRDRTAEGLQEPETDTERRHPDPHRRQSDLDHQRRSRKMRSPPPANTNWPSCAGL